MKNLKTNEIIAAYQMIGAVKINVIKNDDDKFAIIHTISELMKINDAMESFREEALARLKADNHDEMVEKFRMYNADNSSVPAEDVAKADAYLAKLQSDLNRCINDDMRKKHDVEVKVISEASFKQLMDANDWTMEQCALLKAVLC